MLKKPSPNRITIASNTRIDTYPKKKKKKKLI